MMYEKYVLLESFKLYFKKKKAPIDESKKKFKAKVERLKGSISGRHII